MSVDFDELFDNLIITPNYIIQTNLDVFDKKKIQPSKLFQLLKRPSQHKQKKGVKRIAESINSSFVLPWYKRI